MTLPAVSLPSLGMNSRRVLFSSLIEAHWGGSERLWFEAALAGRDAGWEIGASFPYYKDLPQTRSLASAGVRLFYGTPPPARWWRRLGSPRPAPLARFDRALSSFRPEIVVFTQGGTPDGLREMELCRRRGIPYVILNQCVEPLYHEDRLWSGLREAFSAAARVWCVSIENLERLRRHLCLPLPAAEAIPNAYACPHDIEPSWPADDGVWRLATVSRVETRQKGLDLLLDALADPRWSGRPARFTLFGDGPCIQQITTRCAGLAHVSVRGASAPVPEIWAGHHALLLPSRFEGQSLAMIEAMLHARPVVAAPIDGTRGVVLPGRTGFLAGAPESAPAFAAALEEAWEARARWREIGLEARRHIRAHVHPAPGRDLIRRLAALPVFASPASPVS